MFKKYSYLFVLKDFFFKSYNSDTFTGYNEYHIMFLHKDSHNPFWLLLLFVTEARLSKCHNPQTSICVTFSLPYVNCLLSTKSVLVVNTVFVAFFYYIFVKIPGK